MPLEKKHDATRPHSLILHGIKITHPDRVISETGQITSRSRKENWRNTTR